MRITGGRMKTYKTGKMAQVMFKNELDRPNQQGRPVKAWSGNHSGGRVPAEQRPKNRRKV